MQFKELFERSPVEYFIHNETSGKIQFPAGYHRSVSWLPQINDIFPNFSANSTQGHINFHDWAEGGWTVLMSHPSTKSAVSATEWMGIAALKDEIEALGVKVLGFCCEQAVNHARWEDELSAESGLDIDFPTIEDKDGKLSAAFGMIHPKQGADFAIRKTFILDPSMRIKMSYEYPINVGRSIDELLRSVSALQVTEEHRVGMPADWDQGQQCLVAPYVSDAQACAFYGSVRKVNDYFRVIDCPRGPAGINVAGFPPQTVAEAYHRSARFDRDVS